MTDPTQAGDVPVARSREDELEPVELISQSRTVLRVGQAMLATGTGSYRVKTAMQQVARAFDIDRHQAHVTLTEITATSHRGPIFRTEVAEVRSIGVNAHRLQRLTDLVNGLRPGASVDRVNAELDRIQRLGPLYPALLNAFFAAMACGAFAFLNNGGPVEVIGVFLAAGSGQAVRRFSLHRAVNQFAVTTAAAAVACLVYLGFVAALDAVAGAGQGHEAGYVSAVLFLVPGFALVTGALDLAKFDFSAGIAREVYALTVLFAAGIAVWGVSWVAGLSPDPTPPPDLPWAVMLGLRILASGLGVLGFALLFNSPWRMALAAAGIGMIANPVRLELADLGMAMQAATMIATLLVGLLAAWVSPKLGMPRITLSVPAVVIMVPGAAVYRTFVGLNNGDADVAFTAGVQATFVVVAIAVGLAAARILTDRSWGFER